MIVGRVIGRRKVVVSLIGKPDPKCRWCKGTGLVPLFTSSCQCDCVEVTFTDLLTEDEDLIKSLSIPTKYFTNRYTNKYNDAIFRQVPWITQYYKPIDIQKGEK